NPEDYRENYDAVLNHPVQSALYRNVALAYMWDDHDFSGNDSDTSAIGRDTARTVYRERTPHYPIAAAGGTMAQSFTIGRVRVIMTDNRSAAVSPSLRESATKTRLGATQKAWFKQELINARDAGFPLTLWICSQPWIAPAQLGADTWGGYTTERTEIANFIRDNRITNLVLLSGDMHGHAFDDGTHSDYATGGGAPLTVLHAASLTHTGAPKGGPYLGGPILGGQQYGLLEVFDTGGPSVACRYSGKRVGEGEKFPAAYIVPNFAFIREWAERNDHDFSTATNADMAQSTVVNDRIGEEISQFNKHYGNWEQIKKFVLLEKEFAIAAGEITPTLKLKRKKIMENYQSEYAKMYSN
ncbi:MAG: hypothetical protein RL059_1152, partial [Bacteroidota bacterium]